MEEFLHLKYVKKIALVVDNIEKVTSILKEHNLSECHKILLVLGESSRHKSIRAGLKELQLSEKGIRHFS